MKFSCKSDQGVIFLVLDFFVVRSFWKSLIQDIIINDFLLDSQEENCLFFSNFLALYERCVKYNVFLSP